MVSSGSVALVSGGLFGGLLAVVGVGLLAGGFGPMFRRWMVCRRAQAVTGTVRSIDIDTTESAAASVFNPRIEYEYRYDGETYTGSKVYPGSLSADFGSKMGAESLLTEIEAVPDCEITVYVTPNDPGRAFLVKKRVEGLGLFAMAMGLVFLGVGSAFFLY